ncbi:MAG: hypothetical protein ACK4ND_03765 [Cytophagaceae bacterium]
MKRLLPVLISVVFLCSFGNEAVKLKRIKEDNLPAPMAEHLERFCSAKNYARYYYSGDDRDKNKPVYIARLKCDGNKFIITYKNDGSPIMAEMPLKLNELPAAVFYNLENDLKRSVKDFKIKEITEVSIHHLYKYRFLIKDVTKGERVFYTVYADSSGNIRDIILIK